MKIPKNNTKVQKKIFMRFLALEFSKHQK